MDFLTNLFTELNTRDSLLVLLFLFIAFLIGLMTGWLYWRSRLEALRTNLTGTQANLSRLQADFDGQAQRLDEVERERKSVQASWDNCRSQLQDCRADRGQIWADFQALKEATSGEDSEGSNASVGFTTILGHSVASSSEAEKDNLKLISGVGPAIERKLNDLGIYSYEQISQFNDDMVEKVTEAIAFFPGRIARDNWVGQAKALHLQKMEDPASLEKREANPTDPNDLKIIEGIGPKIEELLKAEGIETWGDLASSSETRLREILDAAGDQYRIHDPSTWARQAALALGNEWEAFHEYTDFLRGGREP